MRTRKDLPVQVIVADTGPLISLAACRRLSLLRAFERPVRVPDVVKAEAVRFSDRINAATLADWFAAPDCPVEIIETPLLRAWQDAARVDDTHPGSYQAVGLGDAATTWLLRQMQAGFGLDLPTLVLTEDGPFGDGVLRDQFPEVHVLSTRAFPRTLENFGVIASAEAVVAEIADAGRTLARYMADRPGRPEPGSKTSWASVLASRDRATHAESG